MSKSISWENGGQCPPYLNTTGEATVSRTLSIPMCLLRRMWAVAILLLLLIGAGCANGAVKKPTTRPASGLERFEYVQVHMGTRARLVVWAKDEDTAVGAGSAAYIRGAGGGGILTGYL